jgi:hypothetical protein
MTFFDAIVSGEVIRLSEARRSFDTSLTGRLLRARFDLAVAKGEDRVGDIQG